jgi:phosphate transport system substrate-binding protein
MSCAALQRLLCISIAVVTVACSGRYGASKRGSAHSQKVSVRGSDTMVILMQRFAERYMQDNPTVSVEVSGGGSGTGIAALENGTADLATASRAITPAERASIESKRHAGVRETVVALDAIAIYVHPSNPVASLSLADLSNLYRGNVHRWSTFGGRDAPVVLYGRENSSGTYSYFKEHVLGRLDFAAETQSLPGTAAVIHAVRHDRNGIGYGGIAYANGVRVVPIRAPNGTLELPTREAASVGRYPLARPLFVYDVAAPGTATAKLRAFLLGPSAQAVVEDVGFFPVPGASS